MAHIRNAVVYANGWSGQQELLIGSVLYCGIAFQKGADADSRVLLMNKLAIKLSQMDLR